jgi:hypothetical protein
MADGPRHDEPPTRAADRRCRTRSTFAYDESSELSPACLPHQPLASGQPTALRCTSAPRRPARAIRDRPSAGRYGTPPWTLPMCPEQSRSCYGTRLITVIMPDLGRRGPAPRPDPVLRTRGPTPACRARSARSWSYWSAVGRGRVSAGSCARRAARPLGGGDRPGTDAGLVQVAVDGGAGYPEHVGNLLHGVLAAVVELLDDLGLAGSAAPGYPPATGRVPVLSDTRSSVEAR